VSLAAKTAMRPDALGARTAGRPIFPNFVSSYPKKRGGVRGLPAFQLTWSMPSTQLSVRSVVYSI
jgi:hypothetical protein